MSETEPRKPPHHFVHVPVLIVAWAFCVRWYWHLPTPNKAVLLLGGVAAIMALFEMRPIHKWGYFLLIVSLMLIENRSIDKDRSDFAEAEAGRRTEENKQFSDIGEGLKRAIRQGSDDFNATMSQFSAQTTSLANLERAQRIMSRQVSDMPLSTMSPRELSGQAHAVAQQMRTFKARYSYDDSQLSLVYYDRLEGSGGGWTKKQIDDWRNEELVKRANLRTVYESDARKVIATANRLREAMVNHLIPSDHIPDDTTRAAWFQKPVAERPNFPLYSFLYDLDKNADYLDNLAQRVLSTQGPE